jgi:rod shape-determining protein MreC
MRYTAGYRTELTVVEKGIENIYVPLQGGLSNFKAWTANVGTGLADKKVLASRLEAEQAHNQSLSVENQQLKEYQAEVMRLRTLLKYEDAHAEEFDMETARVIARNANNWYEMLTIDKGLSSGVNPGMSVVNADGLVGRVMSANKDSAKVSLITNREIAVGVIVQETRDTSGIVEGIGSGEALNMINIPYYADIEAGQKVISSGLSEIYPKGLLLGTIQSVKQEEGGLVLRATVRPAVKFDQLEEVLVIKSFQATDENLSGEE